MFKKWYSRRKRLPSKAGAVPGLEMDFSSLPGLPFFWLQQPAAVSNFCALFILLSEVRHSKSHLKVKLKIGKNLWPKPKAKYLLLHMKAYSASYKMCHSYLVCLMALKKSPCFLLDVKMLFLFSYLASKDDQRHTLLKGYLVILNLSSLGD